MKIDNILAVRNDRFGEFLLNIPALRALKGSFPEARLTLVVNPYIAELAARIDFVSEIIPWEHKKHKLGEILRLSRELKKKKFGLCLIFNPSKEFNMVSFLSRIPIRVGYDRKWGFLLTQKMPDKKYLGLKHEVEYNLELAGMVGARTNNLGLSLSIFDAIINNFPGAVAIHPWTSDPQKQWPVGYFRKLTLKLIQDLGSKVVIVGGREEKQKSREYFSQLSPEATDFTGMTSLVELGVLLKQCRLLISGDSGPVHLASCVGTPALVLFRADNPGKSSKRWGPWDKNSSVIEKHRLADISVEEVFLKAKEMLRQNA
ncbi:MAG: glycosyltransferase family 9 protein [Candidatus Omnitrophota bacterium]